MRCVLPMYEGRLRTTMLSMVFLLHSSLSTANDADAARAGRRAETEQRDASRRALLVQLARGRRAPRVAHA
jgi:hypothetical protein